MNQNVISAPRTKPDAVLWKWVVGGLALALASFIAFQTILNTPETTRGFGHFGAEVASAFVGTGLTVAITALLLKFQTDKQIEQQLALLNQEKANATESLSS